MAAQLGDWLLVICHSLLSLLARLHETCGRDREMMEIAFLRIWLKRGERRKTKSPAYGYYTQQVIHGLHGIPIIMYTVFLVNFAFPFSMLCLGKDLLQLILHIVSSGEELNQTLSIRIKQLRDQEEAELELEQNYDVAGSISPTEATSLNTDELVDQQNYDAARSISPTEATSLNTDELVDPQNYDVARSTSPMEATSLNIDELVDQQNYDVARSINPMEATSLNTDELVDQQNYDVAHSITCISNFSHCETQDPIRATEFGTVSSLNTELLHQHTYDAANSVSCTLNFSQWKIRDPPIGVGGFAFVHVASHRETGDLCAVKKLKDPDNRGNASSLIKEIQILSQLQHSCIVKYYGAERVGNQIWLFMEYVETGTLTKYISEEGALQQPFVRHITAQILSVLEYLHSKRVVHRDIKPDNILVDSYGFVKLIDFGMAKHVHESKGSHSMWGTPHYAAPDTLEKKKYSSLDEAHSADLWSLGCVIIEMFTGQRPWSHLEWWQVNREVCWNKRDPEIPQDFSNEGKEFLQLCFERNPAKRLLASELEHHPFVS